MSYAKFGAFETEITRWGSFGSIALFKDEQQHTRVKVLFIEGGQNLSYQKHLHRAEVWHVVSGHGEVIVGDEVIVVSQGDRLYIPKEEWHSARAYTHLNIIEIQYGEKTEETDIERVFYNWGDILAHIAEVKANG